MMFDTVLAVAATLGVAFLAFTYMMYAALFGVACMARNPGASRWFGWLWFASIPIVLGGAAWLSYSLF